MSKCTFSAEMETEVVEGVLLRTTDVGGLSGLRVRKDVREKVVESLRAPSL